MSQGCCGQGLNVRVPKLYVHSFTPAVLAKGPKRQVDGQCFLNKNPIQPEMHPKEIDQQEWAGKVENNEAPDPTKKVFIMTVDV